MTKPKGPSKRGREYTQAERILRKFGGARKLAQVFLVVGKPRHPANIYRWTYPKERGGTGGLIPSNAWGDLLAAAQHVGIPVDAEFLDPRPRPLAEG